MVRMDDPGEFDIIRKIYFEDRSVRVSEIEEVGSEEIMDRWAHRHTTNEAR